MADVPGWLLRHSVTVEPYLGQSAYGPRYGDAVAVPCFLDQQTRMVRATDNTQVTSSSTAYARLETDAPAQSRVTLPGGRVTSVIAALRRDGGGLATPDHLELQLV
jgi:hypothetical protein